MSRKHDPLARDRAPGYLVAQVTSGLLGRRHVEPDFIIVGAARAGTTGLLNQMRTHPGIQFCAREELHFFDVDGRWSQGPGYYRRRFPRRATKAAAIRAGHGPALSGENSPYYLAHPFVPERVRATLPDVRLIALLRDPTERAVSHWNWRVNRQQETRSFEEIVEEELALFGDLPPGGAVPGLAGADRTGTSQPRFDATAGANGVEGRSGAYARVEDDQWARRNRAYLARGIYLEQLQRWHAVFPREQLLTLVSERYYADPAGSMERIWAHLGLPSAPVTEAVRNARRKKAPLDPAVVARVRAFFRPHNAALQAYLDEPLDWE